MSKQKSKPWGYVVLIIIVLFIGKCTLDREAAEREAAEAKAAELKEWQNSPEYRFRYCLSAVGGETMQVSPEQIIECNKAAGR